MVFRSSSRTISIPSLIAIFAIAVFAVASFGCSRLQPAGPAVEEPRLTETAVITADGYQLPMRHWDPVDEPRAIVLGVHGFSDYSNAFGAVSEAVTAQGFALYAYDQRGFGATEPKGIWAGQATLVADLKTVLHLLRQRHPDKPMYLISESMGGAVAALALTDPGAPPINGALLLAPAVWGRDVMPWYQRVGLAITDFLAPGMTFSGKMAGRFGVSATDDPVFARALRLDPLVQKQARVDTLDGLSDLMSAALKALPRIPRPALLLYGASDEVIPPQAMCALLVQVPDGGAPWRMVLYPKGFHLLTRYSGAATTDADIAAWLNDQSAALPSGDEVSIAAARQRLCKGN